MPYLGLTANYRINDFELSGLIKFSNKVTARDHDDHFMRSLSFDETAFNASYVGAIINAGYYFTEKAKIFAEFALNNYQEGKGETFKVDYVKGTLTTISGDSAGIANLNYGITIGVNYQF